MDKANIDDIEKALRNGVLTKNKTEKLKETNEAIERVIAVDDFADEDLLAQRDIV